MSKTVVIVSFSSRKGGNCEQISNYVAGLYPRSDVRMYAFSDFSISPCGSCGYECFRNSEDCPHIADQEAQLLKDVCSAGEAIFIVPNYCDHPCANFYIFNERSLCYFQGHPSRLEQYLRIPKKFLVVSNSESGSFRAAFVQHTTEEPNILYLRARNCGSSSINTAWPQKPQIQGMIADFMNSMDPPCQTHP